MCRRLSGAAFLTFVVFPAEAFTWTSSAPPRRYRSSAGAERGFCERCGSTLATFEAVLPDWMQVTMGSLDHPERIAPQEHIFTDSAMPWLVVGDGLPRYPRFSPHGGIEDPIEGG